MPVVRDAERITSQTSPSSVRRTDAGRGQVVDPLNGRIAADGAMGDRQWTVVMDPSGDLRGQRVVRGREQECLERSRAGSASGPEREALTAPGGDWRQR
jgi:hypothetical protein